MYKPFTKSRIAMAILLSAGISNTTQAQEDVFALEEVIVTAQKRAQNIQDVPISVSAVSGVKIEEAGISDFDDLSRFVPNLNISTGNNTQIRMRGLGSGLNAGFEQSVGMYIDGVYHGRDRTYRGSLLDLDRVEVLRGPQGILFGKNTIAGAINIATAKPSQELEASIGLTYGSYGERKLRGIISGPLSDTLSARLAISDESEDGYIDNSLPAADGAENDNQTIRLSFLWQPNDDLQATLKIEQGDFERRGTTYQVTDTGLVGAATFASFAPGFESRFDEDTHIDNTLGDQVLTTDSENVTLAIEYQLGDFTLVSTSAYIGFDGDDGTDVDFSPLPLLFVDQQQEFQQISQELRLSSPGGELVDYIAGVYYQNSDFTYKNLTLLNLAPLGSGAAAAFKDFDQDSETYAAFVEATWNISDSFTLTGGVRYSRESKQVDSELTALNIDATPADAASIGLLGAVGNFAHVQSEKRSETNLTPLLKATYYFNNDVMAYVTASTGYKSGGFNAEVANPATQPLEFDEETSKAIELGLKTTLLDGSAHFNVSVFRTQFDDLQVSGFDGFAFVVGNAAKATSQGIELDGMWRLSERLTLGGSYSYLDAEYDSYESAPCTVSQKQVASGACQQDLGGKSLHYAPDNSANLNISYELPMGPDYSLGFSADVNYSDDFFLQNDLDPDDAQESFTKVNARVALKNLAQNWELAVVAKNLTDKRTANNGLDIPILQAGTHVRNTLPPRTVAVQLNASF